ncbi:MAG: hypothetical protein IJB55_06060 [Firmicutes bacterium]|nr:hypothetical protein [Bacillota bacterium]
MMPEKLCELLAAWGLAPEGADEVLAALAVERAESKLLTELGIEELTADMAAACLDMAAGEYLMTRLALSPQVFADWQPDVRSLSMGDVSVGYAVGESGRYAGRAGVFQFANGLLMRSREVLAAVRGVKW